MEDILKYLHAGSYELAQERVEHLLSHSPQNSTLHNIYGVVLLKKSLFTHAQAAFQKAISLDNHLEAKMNLCILLSDLGLYEESRQHYVTKLTLKSAYSEFSQDDLLTHHLALFELYGQLNQHAAAEEELEKAQKQAEHSASFLLRIAREWLRLDQKEKAHKILIELCSSSVAYEAHLFLAQIYLQTGRRPEALVHLEHAAKKNNLDLRVIALTEQLKQHKK